jgi:serine/threonine protein kinase
MSDLLCLVHPPLRQHDNIVSLLGLGWELPPSGNDSRLWPYLILEYSTHGTLAQLQASRELTYSTKTQLCIDVAKALEIVHHCNIIHGDVKTENILVFPGGRGGFIAKLSDFGFATLDIDFYSNNREKMGIDDKKMTTPISSGTRPWIPPEFGTEVSWISAFSADVYSWGLLVWRVFLDGKNPFTICQSEFKKSLMVLSDEVNGGDDIMAYKKNDLVLPVAKAWVSKTQQTTDYSLGKVFDRCLGADPATRNLKKAYLPWLIGREYVAESLLTQFKDPKSRQRH